MTKQELNSDSCMPYYVVGLLEVYGKKLVFHRVGGGSLNMGFGDPLGF